MEKILLALDPQNIPMNTIDFACYLSRLAHSRLTGVFLEDVLSGDRPLLPSMPGIPYPDYTPVFNVGASDRKTGITEENIRTFKLACDCRGVPSLIHRDRGVPAAEIVEESRFADIIIVDAETSFSRRNETLPGRFVKDVLLESECPVIIAPYSFERIDDILFTYNGTQSSVFAIKQFTYLFPELRSKKVVVVSVRTEREDTLAEQFKMKEWMKDHYTDVEYVILKGEPSDQLFGYLIERKNGMVVMGAYGRGMLSRFFKPSHARLIVKTINLPIFISHY
jgi:nucleotide-binding universal stress UspA family protein